jgi:chromosome segregation ATPase
MRDAMASGDGAAFIRLDGMIRELEPKIFAAELADASSRIQSNEARRKEIEAEIKVLYEERAKRNRLVAEAYGLYNLARSEMGKVEFAIEMQNSELQSIAVNNRELREKIESLKDAKMQEVMNNARFDK